MTYNSNQIAEIIGVNVSTIKRWTDSGKLECQQTIGGHRKFHLNHLRKFLKKNQKLSVNINLKHLIGDNKSLINAIDKKDTNSLVDYCYKDLILSNSDRFTSLNNSLILKGYPIEKIFDDIVIPSLKIIGEKWANSELSITEEHLATEKVRKFLLNLNLDTAPESPKLNAYCFTLKNDKHDLPLYMGESIFNQNNIESINLGSNLPVNDFISLSNKTSPDIIFISLIYVQDVNEINKEINLLCKTFLGSSTKIFIRGFGFEQTSINYSNFIQVNSFESLKNQISKL